MTSVRHPDVAAPEAVLDDAPDEVAGDAALREHDGAARPVGFPDALQLRSRVGQGSEERFLLAMPRVARGEERPGALDVLVGERAQLHRRA